MVEKELHDLIKQIQARGCRTVSLINLIIAKTNINEEGIEKLTSYLDEDVQEVIDRLLELQDAGNAYTQFSDSGDMGGTVKFIIETAPIE